MKRWCETRAHKFHRSLMIVHESILSWLEQATESNKDRRWTEEWSNCRIVGHRWWHYPRWSVFIGHNRTHCWRIHSYRKDIIRKKKEKEGKKGKKQNIKTSLQQWFWLSFRYYFLEIVTMIYLYIRCNKIFLMIDKGGERRHKCKRVNL